jgi:hypothetical protein
VTELIQIMPPDQPEAVDLNQVYWQRTIADRIKQAMDQHALDNADDGYRTHLGASVIGNECARYIYYHFRWFRREIHSPRMERIFGEGHRVEGEFRAILTACGAEFLDTVDKDGEQLRFSDIGGHYGGSIDGVFRWPEIGLVDPVLLECKSSKTGSPFNSLFKEGVIGAKHQHFLQQSVYGKAFGIKHACYMAYNKNDSSLYIEIVDLSWQAADEMRAKALEIITATKPPKRISNKDTFWLCKMCSMWDICHRDTPIIPNCRNCKHAVAADNKEWHCNLHGGDIPKDFIPKGCNQHENLPR